MKKTDPTYIIYHELSQKYGQRISGKEIREITGVSLKTARRRYPRGWCGGGKGSPCSIGTMSLAEQLCEEEGQSA